MSCDQPKLNEITTEDAAAIISQTAKENGGVIPKGCLASRIQSLADRNAIAKSEPKHATVIDELTRKDGIDAYKECHAQH